MPFEDFYKSADRHAQRWRLCLSAAIFLIAAYCSVPFFLSRFLTSTPEAAPYIPAASESQRRAADMLCRELPQPERLSLASIEEKKTSDGAATVVYTYTSGRGVDEIMPPFLIWFETEGWERVFDEAFARREAPDRVHNFRSRYRRVSVLYFAEQEGVHATHVTRPARYEIVCTVGKMQP